MASRTLFDDQAESEEEIEDEVDARQVQQQLQGNRGQLEAELSITVSSKYQDGQCVFIIFDLYLFNNFKKDTEPADIPAN